MEVPGVLGMMDEQKAVHPVHVISYGRVWMIDDLSM